VLTDVTHFTLNVDSHSKGDVIITLVVPLPHVIPTRNWCINLSVAGAVTNCVNNFLTIMVFQLPISMDR